MGQTSRRLAGALREVQNALLECPKAKAPDGPAAEKESEVSMKWNWQVGGAGQDARSFRREERPVARVR
jgi:hypothetical protein